jgi:hypothetical protein
MLSKIKPSVSLFLREAQRKHSKNFRWERGRLLRSCSIHL